MASKQSSTTKVVMLPWLANGHVTPFLELAKKLSTKNFHIYLCSTPIILTSIQNRITKSESISIELVPLHLPPSPELPPHRHTTNGLPQHLIPNLINAFDLASPDFSKIVQTLRPDLVIYDFFQPWAPTIASEYKIPAVGFVISGAVVFSFVLHLVLSKADVELPFPELQPFLAESFGNARRTEAPVDDGGNDMMSRLLDCMKKSSKMILFNSFTELEGKYLDYLPILTEKKIVPIGPLVQEIVDNEKKDSEIMQWLDTKDELSTVFVSFGSEIYLSKEEIKEIAHGLELSGVNFIWAVRFPVGDRTKIEEALPAEFFQRIGERGLVVEVWVSQAKILAHTSTGGFVSHCGWNSTLESLKYGVPIIAMPMKYDQPFISAMVEDVGVGVEVKRDIANCGFNKENIAQVIRKVVKDESGVDVRTKAAEFSEIIRMKGEKGIDGAIEELVQLCDERKRSEEN